MDQQPALSRPIGSWLREADAHITAAFDQAFATADLDRRRWQLLASLSRGPADRRSLATALRRFDTSADIDTVLDDLIGSGLVATGDDGRLRLTDAGAAVQQRAATQVDAVRGRVVDAQGGDDDDYVQLVTLLAQLVDALDGDAGSQTS
jgi:hypothetical protein